MRIGDGDGPVVASETGNVGLTDSCSECTARQYFNGGQADKAAGSVCIADKYLVAARGKAYKVARSLPVDTVDAVFVSTGST